MIDKKRIWCHFSNQFEGMHGINAVDGGWNTKYPTFIKDIDPEDYLSSQILVHEPEHPLEEMNRIWFFQTKNEMKKFVTTFFSSNSHHIADFTDNEIAIGLVRIYPKIWKNNIVDWSVDESFRRQAKRLREFRLFFKQHDLQEDLLTRAEEIMQQEI